MDVHPFASLAHIRILLLPIGLISQTSFEAYAAEIRSFESIKLSDIPAGARDGRAARFLPNPLVSGHLHLSFPTHAPPRTHTPLSLVRPSHFPLAVIGIAACSQSDSLAALNSQFNTTVHDIFLPDDLFPLAKQCFVFEEGETGGGLTADDASPNMVVVPSIMGNRKLHIGTLLSVMCCNILESFGAMVQALETPLGNEYLNASLMPNLPPLSQLPSPLSSLSRTASPPPLPSHSSQPDVSRPSFSLSPAPTLKRNASATAAATRQPNLNIQAQKKRLSTIGSSSSHARLYKMLGDFFLLAGRLEDATIWYNEAIQLFKSSYDPVWYASALEGTATVTIVEAWSTGQGLQSSSTALKDPWTEINEKLSQAIGLYQRSPAPETEQNHSLLAYLFCCCVLRQSSLLFSIWSAKGWGPLAFTTMLHPGPKPFLPPTLSTPPSESGPLHLEHLSSITGISRASISLSLSQLHGPWLLHLGARERVAILEATASIYSCIGYHRKEAFILREVLGCIMDLIVCGRDEDGITQPSIPLTAGLGINNAPGPPAGTLGVRLSESADGNQGVLRLLLHICRSLGINLEAVSLTESTSESQRDSTPSLDEYDEDLFHELKEPSGWPELQVGVIREAIAVAESLPDFPVVAQFSLSALKTLQSVLSPEDQYHLYTTANRALLTSQRRGDPRLIQYWSGRPIISITVAPLPAIRLPIEKSRSVQYKINDRAPLLHGAPDPFLYNPRRALATGGPSLVVQGELLEFIVTLQNPYVFNLELVELSLSTSGVEFESQPQRVVIPASAIFQVVLAGRALQNGTLTIRGCFVQSPGGARREYMLPLFTAEEEERLSRRRRVLLAETSRFKHPGVNSPESIIQKVAKDRKSSQSETAVGIFKFLQCKVVPEQPLLRIRRTSVAHGALMLYKGERTTIRITLENIFPLPVDFVRLTFEDSTMEPAQKALAEGNLSVFDAYETENSLVNDPVFSWDESEVKTLSPNESLPLTLTCVGKVGCTSGTVHVSYANTQDPILQGSEVFYLRQLSYPVMVTVYHMLECYEMDVFPFPSLGRSAGDPASDTPAGKNMQHIGLEDSTGWCLFSIEVRNSYGSPFDVSLHRTQQGEVEATTTTTIPPGAVSRLVIPIRKVLLGEEVISKPIPMLSDRQFVVSQTGLTKAEERSQQELFWYREELFKSVSAKWQETGGARSGVLSFRTQRMTSHMLDAFRLETAQIFMWLDSTGGVGRLRGSSRGSRHVVPPDCFVALNIEIINLFPASMVFTVDLEFSPSEEVVYEGVSHDLPVGRLENGESAAITTSLCFLASGNFDVWARLRCAGLSEQDRVVRSHITAVVEAGEES